MENESQHWIKLFDRIKQWQHYQESTVLHVFIELLLTANYKDSWVKGHKVKRGELITSVSKISESTGLSHMTIKTALKKLEESKEIKREANNQFTKITINQFNEYQREQIISQQGSQQGSHIIERVEGIYVVEGVEIEKEIFKEKVAAYASEIHSHIDVNDFFNYYDANGWLVNKKPMRNWKLCVQTWTKKDRKDRPWLYEEKKPSVDYTKTAAERRLETWQ